MDERNLLVGAILLLLAGGSWWLASVREPETVLQRPEEHRPDYFLKRFTATVMGPDGKPLRRLKAETMEHFPLDDSTEIEGPQVTIYDPQRPPWRIRSDRGWLSGDAELLLLQGEVRIDRDPGADVRPVHIVTRNLRVQPQQDYAETDERIMVRSGEDWIQSDGMQAWFAKSARIKLLANVRGRYEVN